MPDKARYVLMAGLLALCAAVHAVEPVGLYDFPRLHIQQSRLRVQLMQAVRTGNITNMEAICRQGLNLMPGDATWQYNLACALAYRANPDAALDALELAVKAGFRNAKAIENDTDLKRISSNARFKAIVLMARETADLPVPGIPYRNMRVLQWERGLCSARQTFLGISIEGSTLRFSSSFAERASLPRRWRLCMTALPRMCLPPGLRTELQPAMPATFT